MMNQAMSIQVFNLWVFAIMLAFSTIWQVRNTRRFEDKTLSVKRTCLHIKASLHDIGKICGGTMSNTQNDLCILHSLGIKGIPRKAPTIIAVHWYPPPPTWIKLNTDGLAQGNLGPAVATGIFRSCRGFVKGGFTSNLGVQTAFYAELLAALIGIEYAWRNGWHKLWLESDFATVVHCLQNPSYIPSWSLRTQWLNCQVYLKSMDFQCSHNFREGNCVVDKCANLGIYYSGFQWWWTAP
ncbi:hypothetical protein L1049_002207 [Liquidambar formosana]|uniref:RNase H type-1 domain-containing protein n=1 Tax=Liquidambar formosana TaxID=63359 RepID=A0AAP0R6H2_LIQFO